MASPCVSIRTGKWIRPCCYDPLLTAEILEGLALASVLASLSLGMPFFLEQSPLLVCFLKCPLLRTISCRSRDRFTFRTLRIPTDSSSLLQIRLEGPCYSVRSRLLSHFSREFSRLNNYFWLFSDFIFSQSDRAFFLQRKKTNSHIPPPNGRSRNHRRTHLLVHACRFHHTQRANSNAHSYYTRQQLLF